MRRRDFVNLGSVLAATAPSFSYFKGIRPLLKSYSSGGAIDFMHDGLELSPKDYAELLMKMADEGRIKTDYYSNGGVVEELENKFAMLLGKESAVFMPTGTLANHIAVRRLAESNHRILVQEQSHLYLDTGDCAQTLSGLNLIPLGKNGVEFTQNDVEEAIAITKKGRVETRIGVISIETPVRRQMDRMVPYESIQAIANVAKNNEIKMHLDGARLFVQSVHTGISPSMYSSLFDTVFISMWKCFNAPSGAILAGSKSFCENLFHERRMFGGGLPAAWPLAAVALHYADSFLEDYAAAWKNAQRFFTELEKEEKCKVFYFDNGSHIVHLVIGDTDLAAFSARLKKKNIHLPVPVESGFMVKINPSFNRDTPENLVRYFSEALRKSG